MRARLYTFFSSLLLVAGGFLLFFGGRELVESRLGQSEAAREFHEVEIPSAAPAPEPGATAPDNAAPTPPLVRPGDTLAKLVIPRLDAELYVVEGDDAADLRRGPGHMPGSALPGAEGNCIIAGHRDTHFRVLKDIKAGDEILLETARGKFLYRVTNLRIISPTNTSVLEPTKGAELNLITCYPFYYVGSAPKRFVVEAELAGAVSRAS